MNDTGLVATSATPVPTARVETATMRQGRRIENASIRLYASSSDLPVLAGPGDQVILYIAGKASTEVSQPEALDAIMDIARSPNKPPMAPGNKNTGTKTTAVVTMLPKVPESAVETTSETSFALGRSIDEEKRDESASSTTTALSDTIPIARLIPPRLMQLTDRPSAASTVSVAATDTGIDEATRMPAARSRRSMKSASAAMAAPAAPAMARSRSDGIRARAPVEFKRDPLLTTHDEQAPPRRGPYLDRGKVGNPERSGRTRGYQCRQFAGIGSPSACNGDKFTIGFPECAGGHVIVTYGNRPGDVDYGHSTDGSLHHVYRYGYFAAAASQDDYRASSFDAP
jgi:hypothetical protein